MRLVSRLMLVAALAVLGAASTAAAAGSRRGGRRRAGRTDQPDAGSSTPDANAVFARTLRMGCHGIDVTHAADAG